MNHLADSPLQQFYVPQNYSKKKKRMYHNTFQLSILWVTVYPDCHQLLMLSNFWIFYLGERKKWYSFKVCISLSEKFSYVPWMFGLPYTKIVLGNIHVEYSCYLGSWGSFVFLWKKVILIYLKWRKGGKERNRQRCRKG